MEYFDAHCHIQFDAYDEDRDALIARMNAEKVGALVVGCDLPSSRRAVEVAEKHEHLYASIGLHPNHEADEWFESKNYLALGKSPKVVAVGECGLDYFRPKDTGAETKHKQRAVFEDHIRLALTLDKPLVIHARPTKGTMDAYEDALAIIASYQQEHGEKLRGDFHFFVGDVDTARGIFELGFTISYTAVLTFARDYDEVVRYAPLDRLLAETDAPYVAPLARRGQRNDPISVVDVVRTIAEVRGESLDSVRRALLHNTQTLFSLPI